MDSNNIFVYWLSILNNKPMNTLKQLQDFSPEDIALQVMKAIEVADISDFNGKNVFEAGDYDAIFESIVDGVKQAKTLAFEAGKAEAVAMVLKEIEESYHGYGSGDGYLIDRGFNIALDTLKTKLQAKE